MVVRLGDRVKDTITQFSGIATGKAFYLFGCVQVCVKPEHLDKDEKSISSQWIDEPQLKVVKKGVVVVEDLYSHGPQTDTPPMR